MALGLAGLEQLLDAGQTVGDVLAGATPPVWNVRMVSCVPGSPMDWAAMMPTAVADVDRTGRWPGRQP